jgi:hypothetical protein
MGSTAKLHASGKNFIGYPCEWRTSVSPAVISHYSKARWLGCMLSVYNSGMLANRLRQDVSTADRLVCCCCCCCLAAGIEHRGPVLDLVPIGDYTAKGVYMAKAWKVRGIRGKGAC